MRIAIASDHAGYDLKELLKNRLAAEPDLTLVDLGTHAASPPVDYPDYAKAAAEAVVRGDVDRAIMVCGSGAGACIAADKVPGARAFYAGDTYTAHQGVEHDDGNVLCLGERVTGPELALEITRAFLRAQFTDQERHRRRVGKIAAIEAAGYFPVEALLRQGQSIWVDNIARSMLTSGELRKLAWADRVAGVTSNPTIFEKAMGHGPEYEVPARTLAEQGKTAEEIYWTLAIEDIQGAADILRATYDLTDGQDGYVSLECAPAVANDTQATIAMAADLWQRLDRPNVMIKIPATTEGIPAIEATIAAGINVNITLLFAVELYEQVTYAYLKGLKRFFAGKETRNLAHAATRRPAPMSVASFFVSRVDTAVDKLLGDKIAAAAGGDVSRYEALLGQAAIANARLAYARFAEIFSGTEWDALAARGADVQRPLWASTSTKNPRYRDTRYVEELIGPDTVNTLPPATLEAFKDHGRVTRTIDTPEALERARQTMHALKEVGINLAEVTLQLQRDGVKSFAESYDQLIQTLEERRRALTHA
ncbi:MAG: transaldolase / glucose-6-phosphate isomerase [Sphingomonadales bacterium]|nr:transaldolase / glucose-6-phosphate isomerase [Sphingomonadales bacterium]